MALVAKCTGGKRVNYSKRHSYTARSFAAGISYIHGPGWHVNAWRGPCGRYRNTVFNRKAARHMKRKSASGGNVAKARKNKNIGGPDIHYGPDAAHPDIEEALFSQRKEQFLKKLHDRASTHEKIDAIESHTRGQHDNVMWRELRQESLTASNFGIVAKRKTSTPCHNLVKRLLYSKWEISTPAVLFGRTYEAEAIRKYEIVTGVTVTKCGLFIDIENSFLGASPDGLVGSDTIIEVKCLYSLKDRKLDECKKNACYSIVDGQIR